MCSTQLNRKSRRNLDPETGAPNDAVSLRAGTYRALLAQSERTGKNLSALADEAGVPKAALYRAKARASASQSGDPSERKRGRKQGNPSVVTREIVADLQEIVDIFPDTTLSEMSQLLLTAYDHEHPSVASTIGHVLSRLQVTNKRIVVVPSDRNTPLAIQRRVEWAVTWMALDRAGVQFVYLDESGFNLSLARANGWAFVSVTPEVVRLANRWRNHSLLACLAPRHPFSTYLVKPSSINQDDIVAFVRDTLVPYCARWFPATPTVVVLDNARCHSRAVIDAIVGARMWYLFTIPYSPQLNAIERVFSQVKASIKRSYHPNAMRLVEDIRQGCQGVTVEQTVAYGEAQRSSVELALADSQ